MQTAQQGAAGSPQASRGLADLALALGLLVAKMEEELATAAGHQTKKHAQLGMKAAGRESAGLPVMHLPPVASAQTASRSASRSSTRCTPWCAAVSPSISPFVCSSIHSPCASTALTRPMPSCAEEHAGQRDPCAGLWLGPLAPALQVPWRSLVPVEPAVQRAPLILAASPVARRPWWRRGCRLSPLPLSNVSGACLLLPARHPRSRLVLFSPSASTPSSLAPPLAPALAPPTVLPRSDLSHQGLPGDDPTECSFLFLYVLCSAMLRPVRVIIECRPLCLLAPPLSSRQPV